MSDVDGQSTPRHHRPDPSVDPWFPAVGRHPQPIMETEEPSRERLIATDAWPLPIHDGPSRSAFAAQR